MRDPKMNMDTARKIVEIGMSLLSDGRIRNHRLGNTSRIHSGEMEKKEYHIYRDFLPSKNGRMVYNLTGNDNYE